jgi:NitT/TauT family transport system ATP-binding protein
VTLLAARPQMAAAQAAPGPCAIRVHRVAKTFPTRRGEVRALDTLDFEVPAGQFVSILGPSGCGKSTLLRIVAGLSSGW